MDTLQLVLWVLVGCALLGIFIFLLWIRHALGEERRRARTQAAAIESRLVKELSDTAAAIRTELHHVENDQAATEQLAQRTENRVREAELNLAGIEPQLKHLTERVEGLAEALSRCATRDDIAALSGLVERFGARVERLAGALESAPTRG